MHGLAVLGLVIIIFIIILTRRTSGLTSSNSQCAACPTKPPGTYYTSVEGCTTAACGTCPTVANGNNVLTPCSDATAANPSGSPGSCTLTCNQGYSISTDRLSCVPDCVGAWGACSTTCGPGEYTYRVSTPAGPGGKPCKDTDGTIRNEGDKKPCANPDCGQNCEGSWSNYGACSSICGYGTKTRKFTATKAARNGGTACETTYGLNAHYPESYETTTCTDLPACTSGQACQGAWSDWSACSQPCDGGIQTRTYNVKKAATVGTDGTRGAACPYADGEVQRQNCNQQSCCSSATVGAWEKYGSVRCSGNSSGKPEQLYVRNIVFPAGTPVNTTAASCSINQFATQFTAAGCPDVAPSAGTCSVTGATWNATSGCTLPAADPTGGTCAISGATWSKTNGCQLPATATPTAGTCNGTTSTYSYEDGYATKTGTTTISWVSGQSTCSVSPSSYVIGDYTCPPGSSKIPGVGCMSDSSWGVKVEPSTATCAPGYTKERFVNIYGGPQYKCTATSQSVKTITCPTGYTASSDKTVCNANNPVDISTLTCPANYTPDKTNNKCTANPVSITGLTCPSPYWSENRTINMCSATTVGDQAPTA